VGEKRGKHSHHTRKLSTCFRLTLTSIEFGKFERDWLLCWQNIRLPWNADGLVRCKESKSNSWVVMSACSQFYLTAQVFLGVFSGVSLHGVRSYRYWLISRRVTSYVLASPPVYKLLLSSRRARSFGENPGQVPPKCIYNLTVLWCEMFHETSLYEKWDLASSLSTIQKSNIVILHKCSGPSGNQILLHCENPFSNLVL